MPMPTQEVARIIEEALPGAIVEVIDLVGDGDHLEARVTWSGFAGQSLLAQHTRVMDSLRPYLKETLHALKVKTRTPN